MVGRVSRRLREGEVSSLLRNELLAVRREACSEPVLEERVALLLLLVKEAFSGESSGEAGKAVSTEKLNMRTRRSFSDARPFSSRPSPT